MASQSPRNYTPHQRKIIQRYYDNLSEISHQHLAELVGDLYLAEGKKRTQLWKRAGELMQRLKLPQSRVEHLLKQADPKLLADLVKELESAGT